MSVRVMHSRAGRLDMRAHRLGCAVRRSGFDSLKNLPVLRVGVRRATRREPLQSKKMELLGNPAINLRQPSIPRVRHQKIVEAKVIWIVVSDVVALRLIVHNAQERSQFIALRLRERACELAADLVVESGAQVVELVGFDNRDLADERATVTRERDKALFAQRLKRLENRPAT